MQISDSALETIKLNFELLFFAEKKAAKYILENPEKVVSMSTGELAEKSGVSEATIVRMSKHLGFKGFYQLKVMLAHNLGKDMIFGNIEDPNAITNPEDFFKLLASNMYHIGVHLNDATLENCVELMLKAKTVHLVASGNTIPSAVEFAFRLGRLEIATSSSFSDEIALNNINLCRPGDLVIGISHSGGSKSVIQAMKIAKIHGIDTIAITDMTENPLVYLADYALVSGVESSPVLLFGAETHIHTTAILDALVYFIGRRKKGRMGSRAMFLSETQLGE